MTGLKDTPPYFRDADRRTLLQNNYLFSKLSPRHIARLAACVVGKSIPGATGLFARGEPGSGRFGICQGTVTLSGPWVAGPEGGFKVLARGAISGASACPEA